MTPATPGVYDTCSFWLTVARNALEFFKQGTYLLVQLNVVNDSEDCSGVISSTRVTCEKGR